MCTLNEEEEARRSAGNGRREETKMNNKITASELGKLVWSEDYMRRELGKEGDLEFVSYFTRKDGLPGYIRVAHFLGRCGGVDVYEYKDKLPARQPEK